MLLEPSEQPETIKNQKTSQDVLLTTASEEDITVEEVMVDGDITITNPKKTTTLKLLIISRE